MQRPLVICLTPIKDEAWILERFLKCTSAWADHIIIADQQSTDGSIEIARSFPKVTLIENHSKSFNEPERQKLLIDEARKIHGPKVLLTLDADEFLTANFMTSPEWETILRSPPGTVVRLQWLEIFADTSGLCYFRFPWDPPVGLVDDGTEHHGSTIHSVRIPWKAEAPTLMPTQIKLMHYCLLDRERFKSRIRWYQCFEYLKTKKRPINLYRFYNQDLFVDPEAIAPVPKEWLQGYEQRGIDMSSVCRRSSYRWDREVLDLFEKHGTGKFKRLGVWDTDWTQLHHEFYPRETGKKVIDPRGPLHKLVHRWLRWTQRDFCHYAKRRPARSLMYQTVQKTLGLWGW